MAATKQNIEHLALKKESVPRTPVPYAQPILFRIFSLSQAAMLTFKRAARLASIVDQSKRINAERLPGHGRWNELYGVYTRRPNRLRVAIHTPEQPAVIAVAHTRRYIRKQPSDSCRGHHTPSPWEPLSSLCAKKLESTERPRFSHGMEVGNVRSFAGAGASLNVTGPGVSRLASGKWTPCHGMKPGGCKKAHLGAGGVVPWFAALEQRPCA
ncbi:hypothetical protein VTI28DRAFT_3268 [Corynascus sepedonium]